MAHDRLVQGQRVNKKKSVSCLGNKNGEEKLLKILLEECLTLKMILELIV
jgi:hypothetical protein